jgi:hypothetical protein
MMPEILVLPKMFSYDEYKNLVIECAEKRTTTGSEQSQERIEATKINAQRMKRIDKQVQLHEKIKNIVNNSHLKLAWRVLTESWCGDGAQNIPIIAKIASLAPDNIEFKIILRDENPKIMDACLTNGSRSIPKLICISSESEDEIGTWGPRPLKIQQMVKEYKAQFPKASHDAFVRNLHLWYAKDNGEALQYDFEQLLAEWLKPIKIES